MMLRIALRAHRTSVLVMSALAFFDTFLQGSAFSTAAGTSAAERAAFGREIDSLAAQLAYMLPLPTRADTMAGYIQWRGYGGLTMIVAIWALLAATGAIRNEEERGLLETWLGAGVSRVRLIAARCVAFVLVAAVAVASGALGALAAGASYGEPIGRLGLLELSLALLGLMLTCFAIALLAAQLAPSRAAAAGLGGGVLLGLFLLDGLGRVNAAVGRWSELSPFHLSNATTALAPGGHFDAPATLALYVVALVLAGLAALAFRARDLGAALFARRQPARPAEYRPSPNPLLRLPVLRELYEGRLGLLGWLLGSLATAALMVSLAGSMNDFLHGSPAFADYFTAAGTDDPNLVLLGVFWSGITALLIAVYSIVQVARWADDDSQGRLEMILAQPVPRWRVVAERAGTLALTTALVAGIGGLTIALLAPGRGIRLDGGRLLLATALLVLLALSFGALGATVIARLPRLAVPALGTLAVTGFFIGEIGPLFKWPSWALDLSMFRLYGAPLATGLYATGLYIMAGIVVAGFGLALLAMRSREVGR